MASDCRERRGKFLPSRSRLAGLGQSHDGDGVELTYEDDCKAT